MVDVMKVFDSLDRRQQRGIEMYLRTHPLPIDRIKAAEVRAASLPAGIAGKDNYTRFLTNVLGISDDEVSRSPLDTASSFLPSGKLAAGIAIFGASAILLMIAILTVK
jgi:hypothetical protein